MEICASLILLLFLILSRIEAKCTGTNLERDKFSLPDDYQISTPPNSPEPTRVHLTFYIKHITDVNDVKNEIELQGSLTLKWNESRLITDVGGEEQNLEVDCINVLWTPDIWIENLVYFGLHDVMGDLASLTLVEDQLVYWQSVTVLIRCPMNLDNYPMDHQSCLFRFSANALQTDLQQFEGSVTINDEAQLTKGALEYNVTMENFPETAYRTSSCATQDPCWGQISAQIDLERIFMTHALQTFMPSVCLVVLSWISFLIPPYIVPGRMVLLVTLLLVLFSTYSSSHENAPRSSGVKIQDVWFLGCILFVLSAIFEYAMCLFLKRTMTRNKRKKLMKIQEREEKVAKAHRLFTPSSDIPTISTPDRVKKARLEMQPSQFFGQVDLGNSYGDINDSNMEGEETLENIDYASLKIFPAAFILFLLIFWITSAST